MNRPWKEPIRPQFETVSVCSHASERMERSVLRSRSLRIVSDRERVESTHYSMSSAGYHSTSSALTSSTQYSRGSLHAHDDSLIHSMEGARHAIIYVNSHTSLNDSTTRFDDHQVASNDSTIHFDNRQATSNEQGQAEQGVGSPTFARSFRTFVMDKARALFRRNSRSED